MPTPVHPDITGLVLAGGQGRRMGGVDKGLQTLDGLPLAQHALQKLQPQVGPCMLSANRHLDTYAQLGVPVWADGLQGYAGPLAGLLTGLHHCTTPWLLCVPCDTPRFPADLAERLVAAAHAHTSLLAMASAPDPHQPATLRVQPVFCLVHHSLRPSLEQYLAEGGRKAMAWAALHRPALASFDLPSDDPQAFANANTLADLQALHQQTTP